MKGAIARAEQVAHETPNSWIPQQFDNPANPEIHKRTTGGRNLGRHRRQGGHSGLRPSGTGGTITGLRGE